VVGNWDVIPDTCFIILKIHLFSLIIEPIPWQVRTLIELSFFLFMMSQHDDIDILCELLQPLYLIRVVITPC
jgi:hypothetical protein